MHRCLSLATRLCACSVLGLLLSIDVVFALPATIISLNISAVDAGSPTLSAPLHQASCDNHMGKVTYSDCDAAIALLPRDPRGQPVTRNFYAATADQSSIMPNVQLPVERTSGRHSQKNVAISLTRCQGGCTVQLLLAANFNDVPHDQSTWIELIGPLRDILRQCARMKGTGGVLVRQGTQSETH